MDYVFDRKYEDRRLLVDGTKFRKCTFIRCKLIFKASDTIAFEDCTFEECDWLFEDAALITLQYLSALYRGLGIEGQRLVDSIVQSIKDGELGKAVHHPTMMSAL